MRSLDRLRPSRVGAVSALLLASSCPALCLVLLEQAAIAQLRKPRRRRAANWRTPPDGSALRLRRFTSSALLLSSPLPAGCWRVMRCS